MLSGQTFLGKVLRLPLSLIPREAEVRILRGPLRGSKWIAGASNHACWAGTYEVSRLRAFGAAVFPGATVYDIGANVGLYTLLASKNAGPNGRVCAFEPLERNLRYLRRHLALNHVQNCEVLGAAVSDREGINGFSAASWDSSMGHLSPDGELQVRSVTLDGCLYERHALRLPDILKIDVEGAERAVLEGGTRAITERHPVVFVEVHGSQQHADCRAFLVAKGYRIEEGYGWITAI